MPVAEILASVDVVVTDINVFVGVGMFAPPDHMLIIANASAQFCFCKLIGIWQKTAEIVNLLDKVSIRTEITLSYVTEVTRLVAYRIN